MIRSTTPVTEQISFRQSLRQFLIVIFSIMFAVNAWCMDIIKKYNTIKTLTVTDFLKVNGVKR